MTTSDIHNREIDMQDSTQTYDTFVVAASAGGVDAVSRLVAELPRDFSGTVFVTVHTSPQNRYCYLADILDRRTELNCRPASHKAVGAAGQVLVAPPDHHLIVKKDHVELSRGPHENYSRPAADPMFRSAAASRGGRVVGIVMTGYLDDGSSGLIAIGKCGGTTVVQDPSEAAVPDMPENAIHYASPQYILPIRDIAQLMIRLSRTRAEMSLPPTAQLMAELRFAESFTSSIAAEESLGKLSPYMCPDCNGQMWESHVDQVPRYRCHVGHSYTLRSLLSGQNETIERSAWATLRLLAERQRALMTLASHEEQSGRVALASHYRKLAETTAMQFRSVQKSFDPEDVPPSANSSSDSRLQDLAPKRR